MKTRNFVVKLSHCYAAREFGETLIVQAVDQQRALKVLQGHLSEMTAEPMDRNGRFNVDLGYHIQLHGISEVKDFDSLVTSLPIFHQDDYINDDFSTGDTEDEGS